MYETLVAALRNVNEYDSGYAKLMYDAADAIEAQDRHILTIQHEMMAEAESHIAEMNRLNKQIEELQADVRPVVQRDEVMQALNKYFSIGDSYTYELNRVKEAFYVGTMTFDDFEEWNEDNVSDLCDYLMKELFDPNCGARMEER